jgi:hypothetical protein
LPGTAAATALHMASRRLGGSASALRVALLASLGLLGVACGGSSTSDGALTSTVGQCSSPRIDPKTQLQVCEEGYSHRPQAVRCQPSADVPAAGMDAAPPGLSYCDGDDCSRLKNGYCAFAGYAPAQCKSGCVEDADCEAGFVCSCTSGASPTGGECVPSDCTTDADCGGSLCASARQMCGELRFACQSQADECASDEDCSSAGHGICTIGVEGHRECFGGACGRPFLVLTEQRLPPATHRGDWLETATPRVDQLSFGERAELARHWTTLGQMEHASIAAFARFSLQLLSLGAPPELVEACTQALADETAHTKLCFGIASAYAGHAIGPGPLDVSDSLNVTTLSDIVDLVIAEGCFGEASAALAALEAARTATDPVIVAAYARIAADEQRHAELAFRFVRWALGVGGSAVSERIEAALASELGQSHAARSVAGPCLSALISSWTAQPKTPSGVPIKLCQAK